MVKTRYLTISIFQIYSAAFIVVFQSLPEVDTFGFSQHGLVGETFKDENAASGEGFPGPSRSYPMGQTGQVEASGTYHRLYE